MQKCRIWKMKEHKYPVCKKSSKKNQVCAIFHRIKCKILGKKFYPNLQSFVWRRHVGVPLRGTNMAAEKQQTSIFEFSYKSVNTSLEKLIKIKVIFILRQGMLKNTKSVKSVTLVTHIRAFPAAGG